MKKHIRTPARYLLENQFGYIVLTIFISAGIGIFVFLTRSSNHWAWSLDSWYGKFIDPIFGVATVLIAIGIWLFENKQEWKENLPKKLSVLFLYKGEPCYFAHKATLFDESDTRALALSIGGQMIGSPFIPYSPFMYTESSIDADDKFKHLLVVFDIIKELERRDKKPFFPNKNEIIVWTNSGRKNYLQKGNSKASNYLPEKHRLIIDDLTEKYKNEIGKNYKYPNV